MNAQPEPTAPKSPRLHDFVTEKITIDMPDFALNDYDTEVRAGATGAGPLAATLQQQELAVTENIQTFESHTPAAMELTEKSTHMGKFVAEPDASRFTSTEGRTALIAAILVALALGINLHASLSGRDASAPPTETTDVAETVPTDNTDVMLPEGSLSFVSLPPNTGVLILGFTAADTHQENPFRLVLTTPSEAVKLQYGYYTLSLFDATAYTQALDPLPRIRYQRSFTLSPEKTNANFAIAEEDLHTFSATVKSEPIGADVLIENKKMGITPFTTNLPFGANVVVIQHEGFLPATIEIKSDVNAETVIHQVKLAKVETPIQAEPTVAVDPLIQPDTVAASPTPEPATAPTAEPVATLPSTTPEPVATVPAPEPSAVQPSMEPLAPLPDPNPVGLLPTAEPIAEPTTPEPVATLPVPEPVATLPPPDPIVAPTPDPGSASALLTLPPVISMDDSDENQAAPEDPLKVAAALLKEHKSKEAIAVLKAALAKASAREKGQIQQSLGRAYLASGQYAAALEMFSKPQNSTSAASLLGQVRAHIGLKDEKTAYALLMKFLSNQSHSSNAEARALFKKLSGGKAAVLITTVPEAAHIHVGDKKLLKSSPVILSELEAKDYQLKIEKEGFQPYEKNQPLKAGEFVSIKIKLEPKP